MKMILQALGGFTIFTGMFVGVFSLGVQPDNRPPVGWTTQAKVVRVIDGDTIVVEVKRTLTIRMLDCWAPETRLQSKIRDPFERVLEKRRGLASKKHLESMALNKVVTVHVPTRRDGDVSKIFTFGRVLGTVWADDEKSLNARMVEAGHATFSK